MYDPPMDDQEYLHYRGLEEIERLKSENAELIEQIERLKEERREWRRYAQRLKYKDLANVSAENARLKEMIQYPLITASHEPCDENRYIKHIVKEGARYHVLSWDSFGAKCSEPKCEINRVRQERKNVKDET